MEFIVQFIPLILIFAVFYFLLIRPQQRRAKEHRDMVSAMPVSYTHLTLPTKLAV